jgi:hypothetical protein
MQIRSINAPSRMAATILAVACGSGDAGSRGAVVHDSAGVTIIESAAPAWRAGAGWTVDTVPVLEIGTVMGDSLYEFGSVMGALRLDDGRIVVADDRAKQLRFYSPQGKFLIAVGRQGGGPGEFGALGGVFAWRGDSIAVFDYGLRRVSLHDANAGFGRNLEFRTIPGYWVQGVLQDSLFLLRSFGSGRPPLEVPGIYWDSTDLILAGPDGQADTLGRFPQRMVAGSAGRDLRTLLGNPDFVQLAPVLSASVAKGGIATGTGESFQIDMYDAGGHLIRRIRRAWSPERVTADFLENYKNARMTYLLNLSRSADATRLRERIDNLMYLETLPAFLGIDVDDDGYLWASEYRTPWQAPGQWTVFDSAGTWLGEVRQPPFNQVFQIGRDFVLALRLDDVGAQYIRLYRVNRR